MSTINTSLSAMQAATTQVNASAHNVANVNTDGFKKLEARLSEGKDGGVVVTIGESKEDASLPGYQVLGNKAPERSSTDLVEEVLGEGNARRLLEANVKAAQTADEMEHQAIDIRA